jgi:rod shape determining protein RodA
MSFLSSHLKKLDWGIIISACVLVLFGLAGIFSAGWAKSDLSNFYKQVVFFVLGFLLMILMSGIDYRLVKNNSYLILILYGVCLFLLAGLHFFAPVIKGTRGWYKIGFLSLDPIEPTKIVLLFLLAKYFSMRHVEMYKFGHIVLSGLYVAMPALLIFIKPDLGGTAILVLMWLGVLLISGIKTKHLLIILFCFILIATLSWAFLLKDYQKDRITSFMFPTDPLGSSWSQDQAKIAIGSGQIWGEGFLNGSQVQYGFLPEPHTDFIFSAIAQEWGAIGVFVLFFAYGFLIYKILQISVNSQSNFSRLFASGFVIILICQFFLNIGMNLSLLPVVGIYLPFVSYGGSGLFFYFLALGIFRSIKLNK